MRAERRGRPGRATRGFTLVEVLVAVAIVALAVTGILMVMMRQIDGTAYLRDKLFAHWVALNQMELAVLANNNGAELPRDTLTGSEDMAGRTWYWRAQPKATANKGAVQLEITVSAYEGKDAPGLANVTAILDTFHQLP